jgi:hypothetical protein
MEAAIITLSITLFFCIIFLGVIVKKYTDLLQKLNETVSNINKEKEKLDKLVEIEPGDSAIIPNYGLQYTDDSTGKEVVTSFKVTYEVEIIEVAKDKVKVTAKDFTSTDSIARDPKKKQGIIDFLQDKWVDKSSIELVMDAQKRRNIKLNELGI